MSSGGRSLAGATAPPIGDGNSPWNEGFAFRSVEEFAQFRAQRPDLFDPELTPEERSERWKRFGQSRVGQALRWR